MSRLRVAAGDFNPWRGCDRLVRGKRVPLAPLDAAKDVAAHTPGPADLAEQHNVQAQVLTAVRSLPESQREVIVVVGAFVLVKRRH